MTAAARSTELHSLSQLGIGCDESMSWCHSVHDRACAQRIVEVEGFLVPCVLCGQAPVDRSYMYPSWTH